jgi:hypothetical protein
MGVRRRALNLFHEFIGHSQRISCHAHGETIPALGNISSPFPSVNQ